MGGVYRIQTFFGFLYIFYIYKAPKCALFRWHPAFLKTWAEDCTMEPSQLWNDLPANLCKKCAICSNYFEIYFS